MERNPANHLGCIKPFKSWNLYHINWFFRICDFLPRRLPSTKGRQPGFHHGGLLRQREPPIWSQVVRGLRVLSLEPPNSSTRIFAPKKTQLSRSFSQRVSENHCKNDAKGRRSFPFLGRKTHFQGYILLY